MTAGDKTLSEILAARPMTQPVRFIGRRGGVPAYEMPFTVEEDLKGVIIGNKQDDRGPIMYLDPSTRHKRRSLIRLLVDAYRDSAERIVVTKVYRAEGAS